MKAKRSRPPKRRGECVYCGSPATTLDHVPPQSFFPRFPPPNLITVPSCQKCNVSFKGDDDYARLVLTTVGSKGNPDRDDVLPRVVRYTQRNESRRFLASFYESLGSAYRRNADGVYVQAQHFNVEIGRLDRFARRVVQALFYREKGYRLPKDHLVNAIHPVRQAHFGREEHEFFDGIVFDLRGERRRKWGNTFGYAWVQSPNGTSMTWWLLEFYGSDRYVCSTVPTSDLKRLVLPSSDTNLVAL